MSHRILIVTILAAALFINGCASMRAGSDDQTAMDLAYPELKDRAELSAVQHEQVADRYAASGKPEMAFMHYNRALQDLGEDSHLARTLAVKKGLLLLDANMDEQALYEFQQVLKADPGHGLANEAAGIVYFRSGLLPEARAHFDRALDADPKLWRSHQYLGILFSRDSRFDMAISEFTSSLAVSPGQAGTLNNLGVAYLARGEYAKALDAFRRAIKAGADKEKTYNNVGMALARMGKTQEALEAFKYAGDESKAYNNLGYVLMLMGDTGRAVTCFEKAIQLSPTYYGKAFENLKQARMAERFRQAGLDGPVPQAVPAPQAVTPEIPAAHEPAAEEEIAAEPVSYPEPATSRQELTGTTLQSTTVPEALVQRTVPGMGRTSLSLGAPELNDHLVLAASVSATAATAAQKTYFGLHVSSFKEYGKAQIQAEGLRGQGLDALVVRVDLGEKGVWFRVMAGHYPTRAHAKQARNNVRKQLGIESLPILEFSNPALTNTPPDPPGEVT